ncbi:2-oxoglutarate-dependent dioxygenase DAO [Thalictrum thalictroides]|uniref:2-oxoglutarate-dependent dioxygenase DAO n=1 Tax=Thalictrum thalictroides TaxID=46969 RepID=A0A7J6XCV4_THATH|nr:2-oxoglutarate-dependent dioxygenase DAO [Thalictrum thalictroides]
MVMELKVKNQIPCIDFTNDPQNLEEGSEGWNDLCNQVREACEQYGSFQVLYNKIPSSLCQDVFNECKGLFDLPDETKQKNLSPKPYYGYAKSDMLPFYEGFGVENPLLLDAVQDFMELMWAQGNPKFCETLHSVATKLHELELIVLKMLCQTYGVEKHFEAQAKRFENTFRLLKYKVPPQSDSVVVLGAHTDKGSITVLCQDGVEGLEVLSKEREWLQVAALKGAFVVFVGDSLKAWSNGRLYAAKHRVVLSGDKERFSYALFASPKEGVIIEVPEELVDQEHPLLYKPFNFMDFFNQFLATDLKFNENPLEAYTGV